MAGPVTGFVNYNQDGTTGDLRLVIKIANGPSNTNFIVYLVCGPTHATGCNFDDFGTVTTNAQGNGNTSAIVIPKCVAQGILDGYVGMLGHVDLIGGGNVLAATAVDFDETVGPACGT
jgi:hypothetical protein